MASVTKTVRFTAEELKLIESFLKANPFLDFSSLVRLATTSFVRKPELSLKGVAGKSSVRREKGEEAVHG